MHRPIFLHITVLDCTIYGLSIAAYDRLKELYTIFMKLIAASSFAAQFRVEIF